MRLYELDCGMRPQTLAELVPTYLDSIPADPCFDDGRPIEYFPDGPRRSLRAGGEPRNGPHTLEEYLMFYLNGDRPVLYPYRSDDGD